MDRRARRRQATASTSSPGKYEAWARSTSRSSRRCCARPFRSSTGSSRTMILTAQRRAAHSGGREAEFPTTARLEGGHRVAQIDAGAPHRDKSGASPNALGPTPRARGRGSAHPRLGPEVAALCGREAGAEAGVDTHKKLACAIVICARGPRGGWPHRRDRLGRPLARGDRRGPRRRRSSAAGGIGTGRQIAAALAMGAQGVWHRLHLADRAGSRGAAGATRRAPRGRQPDTVRSRGRLPESPASCSATLDRGVEKTVLPSRSACRSSSWSRPTAVARGHRYAQGKDVLFNRSGRSSDR